MTMQVLSKEEPFDYGETLKVEIFENEDFITKGDKVSALGKGSFTFKPINQERTILTNTECPETKKLVPDKRTTEMGVTTSF